MSDVPNPDETMPIDELTAALGEQGTPWTPAANEEQGVAS